MYVLRRLTQIHTGDYKSQHNLVVLSHSFILVNGQKINISTYFSNQIDSIGIDRSTLKIVIK